jgi:methionine--tRNA ligase beta chain
MIGYADGVIVVWEGKRARQTISCDSPVNGIVLSSSGKLLVASLSSKKAIIWSLDQSSGQYKEQALLQGHTKIVKDCDISKSERFIVTSSQDGSVRVWDASSGAQTACFEAHSDGAVAVCISPDGSLIASASFDKTTKVFDVAQKAEVAEIVGHSHFCTACAFSPDGKLLATGSADFSIRVFPTSVQTLASKGGLASEHFKLIICMRFSPTADALVSGSWDRSAKLFHSDGSLVATMPHFKRVNAIDVSKDGSAVATGSSDNLVRLFGEPSWSKPHSTLQGHKAPVFACVFTCDAKYVISGSCDGHIRFHDVESGEEIGNIAAHNDWVCSLALFDNDTRLVSGSKSGQCKVWSTMSSDELATLQGHTKAVLGIVASGALIATCAEDRTARIWSAATYECLHVLRGHGHEIGGLAFVRSNPRLLITASSDKSIRIWDTLAGSEIWAYFLPTAAISVVSLQPGNLAVGDSVGNIHLLSMHNVAPAPVDAFSQLDLRVGRVISCEMVSGSDKLILEEVDIGEPKVRQIVSGIAHYISPQKLRGRMVVAHCNLQSTTFLGKVQSDGMLIGAYQEVTGTTHGHVELLDPPEGSAPGDVVALRGCAIPNPPAKVRRSAWDPLEKHLLARDSDGVVCMAGIPLVTKNGFIRAATLRGAKVG